MGLYEIAHSSESKTFRNAKEANAYKKLFKRLNIPGPQSSNEQHKGCE
jgi:hypothetical protein